MKAICSIASADSTVFSYSLANLRLKLSHPKLLSTIHRFFSGTKPLTDSGPESYFHLPAISVLYIVYKSSTVAVVSSYLL